MGLVDNDGILSFKIQSSIRFLSTLFSLNLGVFASTGFFDSCSVSSLAQRLVELWLSGVSCPCVVWL